MSGQAGAQSASYSKIHRAAELVGIVVLLSSIAYGVWQVALHTSDGLRGGLVALGVGIGYLLADLGSGIVHWMGDRYGTEQTPLVGPNFIRPFREHHVDPKGMTRHDFIETNGNNSLVTLPVIGACFVIFPLETAWGLFGFCTIVSMAAWVFATNQFHKWSHEEDAPALVKWLQRNHVILGVEHHDVHHTYPYETYYCITSGWLNEPLHRLRFWSRAEALVERVFGVAAFRDPNDPNAPPAG